MRRSTKRLLLFGAVCFCIGILGFWARSILCPIAGMEEVFRLDHVPNPLAVRYAVAFHDEKWDDVIDMVSWMRDHLVRVRVSEGTPRAVRDAREALVQQVSRRFLGANQLRPEGVEDQYVFAPGAVVIPLGADAGRLDLSHPVADRTWFCVEFSDEATALRDENGVAIRSLKVGVNVSSTGYVLKAAVVGNLEIDRNSLSLDWHP